ncbi:DUF885 family protein [uncultured Alsobacter sp.]|uniref:DUF885 family protein n=1 Tax=uncultured Alsobacter sp. TaxID=1748258 RepID=UPI0025F84090|nr:DUF885 family protein [uncultured Alsobacter sp.]
MPEALERLVGGFLDHLARFHPVDASFIGIAGHDHRLPPAAPDTAEAERASVAALLQALDRAPPQDSAGGRLDARLMRASLLHAQAALDHWPRFVQPSWYTGEVAFGLISLLLPGARDIPPDALRQRLEAAPAFLADGLRHIGRRPTPADWCERARRECAALDRLLATGLPMHPSWTQALEHPAGKAREALAAFSQALQGLPDRAPACGRDYLALLMREVHGLAWSPEEAVAFASDAFRDLSARIEAHPARTAAPDPVVPVADLPSAYRHWHERTMATAGGLVTPATDYDLSFRPLPDWAAGVAGDLYFLSYRCPSALAAGTGSIYWTAPVPQPLTAVKQTHAMHHGSIGHHTQNARARKAASRLARIGGNDCASGIALLAAGTMIEGWACYVTELASELDGLYDERDDLASLVAQRRNAASVLADIGLHAGGWGLERMRSFYTDEAGFPAPRVWSETTRNSILPATRLMYFLGTRQIWDLRRTIGGDTRAFHDGFLSYGHVPVSWIGEEMARG